jgi:signal transduction histidine kinase
VQVADDGRGVDLQSAEAQAHGRLGILGMRERATVLDGWLAFESSPGTGTRIQLWLPLPEPAKKAEIQEAHA